jgi:cellulase/cellobiase CelA1
VTVTASYSVRTDWGDGFVADIIVRNASDGPATWVVDITYTDDVSISSSNTWNASVERLGPTYRFRSTWVLKPGESVQFGFVASKRQTSSVPSRCVVNGSPCS